MSKDTLLILVISGILLFIWLPALTISARKAMRKDQKGPTRTDRASQTNQQS